MKLIDRIFGRETRATLPHPSWEYLAANAIDGAGIISANKAENLSTLYACVQAISSATASLPVFVYKPIGAGREIDEGHPVSVMIRNGPNRHQTWPDWVEWMMASVLLRGNALSEIVTDAAGRVIGLEPIPWDHVNVILLPSGRLAYDVAAINGLYGATGRLRRVLDTEVLHIRDRSDDGLVGRSRLSRVAETVGAALAVQEFTGSMFRNGVNPSGAITTPSLLTEKQRLQVRDQFVNKFVGAGNAAKVLVMEAGMTWQQISVSPEDAELLASRRFSAEELARLYQVPPPLVGIWDHSSFTNSETAGKWFAQFTLGPWVRKIEAAFARSIFTSGPNRRTLELDMSGFMRGDYAARWASHKIAVEAGILTRDEIRAEEGWNPLPGGAPPGSAAKLEDTKNEP